MVLVISRHVTNMGKRLLWPGKNWPLSKQEKSSCRRAIPSGLPLFVTKRLCGNDVGEGPVHMLSVGAVFWGRHVGSSQQEVVFF